jgi:hypothetical protein
MADIWPALPVAGALKATALSHAMIENARRTGAL